jgi:N-methylhydantoinase A
MRTPINTCPEPVLQIGADVGGTFTDLVGVESRSGRIFRAKVLTTQTEPEKGILVGADRLLKASGLTPKHVAIVVHGTTLAANALIERKGARVGLLTTEGHRDTLEMGYEFRYDLYDLAMRRAEPLVPRWLRLGVPERVDADGTVLKSLDTQIVAEHTRALVSEDVQSIAIGFLHSYRNPAHEREARAIVMELHSELPVTISSDIAPEIREHDRFSTAIVNAYVQPLLSKYLGQLKDRLDRWGFMGRLYIMLSGGGLGSVERARTFPVHLVESGPAGGILAATHFGRSAGSTDLLTFDMGGTTAKLSIVEQCEPRMAHGTEVGRAHRFKRGSGLPIRIPVLEMIEIGAGGGSIAWIDSMGLLKIGPHSAAASPGPASYGQGGAYPTVTDADLILGMLNPTYFLGGELTLDDARAHAAIEEHVASKLKITVRDAASGIHSLVNENMAQAARMHLAERGVDPRRFTLVASGGAGPVHAYGIARLLKLEHVVCPLGAGVASALGLLLSPPAVDLVRSWGKPIGDAHVDEIVGLKREMTREALASLSNLGVSRTDVRLRWSADVRHVGQGFDVNVSLDRFPLPVVALRRRFDRQYEREYGRRIEGVSIEVMAWRLNATGIPLQVLGQENGHVGSVPALKGSRVVTFPELGPLQCNIYDRYGLVAGDKLKGPAVIEERESTIVFGPDAICRIDASHNAILDLKKSS